MYILSKLCAVNIKTQIHAIKLNFQLKAPLKLAQINLNSTNGKLIKIRGSTVSENGIIWSLQTEKTNFKCTILTNIQICSSSHTTILKYFSKDVW